MNMWPTFADQQKTGEWNDMRTDGMKWMNVINELNEKNETNEINEYSTTWMKCSWNQWHVTGSPRITVLNPSMVLTNYLFSVGYILGYTR